jgi:hypothetical protein
MMRSRSICRADDHSSAVGAGNDVAEPDRGKDRDGQVHVPAVVEDFGEARGGGVRERRVRVVKTTRNRGMFSARGSAVRSSGSPRRTMPHVCKAMKPSSNTSPTADRMRSLSAECLWAGTEKYREQLMIKATAIVLVLLVTPMVTVCLTRRKAFWVVRCPSPSGGAGRSREFRVGRR